MPLLMSAYCLQYIDKSAMSYAAVFKFRQGSMESDAPPSLSLKRCHIDNHLTPHHYQWLGSCYYLGYLFFEFPGR